MNIIDRALDGWTEDRWCRTGAADSEGRVCLVSRLTEVAGEDYHDEGSEYKRACQAVREVLREQYGFGVIGVFNDHPTRTFAEIRAVAEKASVRLDEVM